MRKFCEWSSMSGRNHQLTILSINFSIIVKGLAVGTGTRRRGVGGNAARAGQGVTSKLDGSVYGNGRGIGRGRCRGVTTSECLLARHTVYGIGRVAYVRRFWLSRRNRHRGSVEQHFFEYLC